MRLRAYVHSNKGATRHSVGKLEDGDLVESYVLPVPAWLEIAQQQDGVFLFHYDARGKCFADTWHESVTDAQAQAEFEFGILPDQWELLE
jgi:hypothetical protein